MSTPIGIIHNFVEALTTTSKTGTAAVDEALATVGAKNYLTFKANFVSAQSGLSTEQFLKKYCGIDITNTDVGAITGSDASGKASGKTTKTAENIVPESSKLKEPTDEQYSSFTKNGLKVNVTYEFDSYGDANYSYSQELYLLKQLIVTRALYNWWIPESLDIINESLGINFTDDRASINQLNVKFVRNYSYNVGLDFKYDSKGYASEATLYISTAFLFNLSEDDKNGEVHGSATGIRSTLYGLNNSINSTTSSNSSNYLDRMILQALAEVTLKANVPYVDNLPRDIRGGLVALVSGYDDNAVELHMYRLTDNSTDTDLTGYTRLRYLAQSYSDGKPEDTIYIHNKDNKTGNTGGDTFIVTSKTKKATINSGGGNDSIEAFGGDDVLINATKAAEKLTVTKSKIKGSGTIATVKGGAGNDTLVGSDGEDVLIGEAGNDSLSGGKGNDTLQGDAGNDKLVGGAGNDSLNGGTGNDTLSGHAGNDKLFGESGNDSLNGGKGNDSLDGGKGNDILWGEAGNDIFIYSAGNDSIMDYVAGEDKIKIASGTISKTSVDGKDVIFTVGDGSITVKDAVGKTLTLVNSSNKESTTVVRGATKLTVNDKTKSPVTADDGIKIIDGSKRTTPVEINGNDIANTISGGSDADTLRGAGGNDSIVGNAGDDKIFGDAGKDTLAGGAGKDTLSGGNGNDYLLGEAGNDSLSGGAGDDTLSGGKGNDTLRGGDGFDVFVYEAGKDAIADYAAGDKISLGAEISKAKASGSDVVFTVGKGSLTVKDGKGKVLSMIAPDGSSYVTLVGGTTMNITNEIDSPVTASDGVKVLNASKRTTSVEIIGNDIANTINGGSKADTLRGADGNDYLFGNKGNDKIYGGAGNDYLYGGAGNDSLWGNAGKDTFVYMNGDGKDVIFGFEDDDMLQVMDEFTSTCKNGIITLNMGGGGSITLKEYTASNFNINGTTYKISGSKLK